MATRKPASVLPEPVGAAIRVSRPGGDQRPAPRLRLGRAVGEAAPEPLRHRGMEPGRGPPAGGAKGVSGAKTMPLMVRSGCDNRRPDLR